MNKKLTAKIQKLIPALGETEAVFSSSIAIEPTEKELVLRKGNVYTVFDITSTLPLNVSLLSKVINDVLYESYYHSDSVSPIQSLEKAVVNINEKLSTLVKQVAEAESSSENDAAAEVKLEFNILAGVLWGNVLYVVQYGKGKSFYMREGEIKEIDSTSEGNFSVASGVVNPNDVIVLNTLSFTQKFPPDKLLGTALSSNDLEPSQSCMILKFIVDTEFTEDEVVDFNLPKEKKSSRISLMLEGLKNRKEKRETKVQPIETLADIGMETTPTTNVGRIDTPKTSPKVKIKSSLKPKIKVNTKSLLMVFFILLIVSVFISILIKNNKNITEEEAAKAAESSLKVPKELNKPTTEVQKPAEKVVENNAAEDLANKVSRIDAQPFYDIKLADETANPKYIAVFSSTVVVADPTSGKIFTSNVDTPKFVALETTYPGIKNLVNYDGKLNFTDSAGYKILNLADNTVTYSFDGSFGVANVYLDNVYSVADEKITKFKKSGDKLEESAWGENAKLADITAIDIAYSIYTTTKSGGVDVYTQGDLANFKITGLDVPLLNPIDIEADVNFDYIYVADAGNKRIVVLKSNGEFIRQLKAVNESEWDNLLGITVSSDEKMMYILNGSKVFDVDLEEAMKPLVDEVAKTDSTADTTEKEDVVVDGTGENTPTE